MKEERQHVINKPLRDHESMSVEKAMHILCGHCADDTDEKHLFGKVAGSFFCQRHVSGDGSVSVRKPGYSVESPKSVEVA